MDVQVADTGPCRRTLTIKIPADQVRQHLDQAFKSASHQVQLKGFRPGKIPRAVLEKKYGPAIHAEARESLVRSSVANACREHQLVTVGRAQVEGLDNEPIGAHADVEFRVHLDIRPKIELKDVTGIELSAQPTEVTDDDLAHALGELANQKRTLEPVGEPIEDGDFAKVDMLFKTEDGTEVSKREGVQINPSIPIAGTDPEAFKSQLTGRTAGETLSFDLVFPDTFDREQVRGQKGTVEVTIHEIMRVQPAPLDDDLAKSFEFDTLDALKTELRARIGEEKVRSEENRQLDFLFETISNDHPFDLPASLIDDEISHGLSQFEARLKQAKLSEAEIKTKLEEAQEPARSDAERRVRMFFLIEAIAQKHQISVTESDIDVELRNIAAHNNATPAEVRKHYEEQDALSNLRLALVERKVRDFLRENAKITDK